MVAERKLEIELVCEGQRLYGDADGGVQSAELPGSGSGSLVFLIHTDGLSATQAAGIEGFRHVFVEKRMLSQAEYERRVTGSTRSKGARERGSKGARARGKKGGREQGNLAAVGVLRPAP
jgi:hypothetical protein